MGPAEEAASWVGRGPPMSGKDAGRGRGGGPPATRDAFTAHLTVLGPGAVRLCTNEMGRHAALRAAPTATDLCITKDLSAEATSTMA